MPDVIDWKPLVRRLKRGECTPFLGAGACADVLPTGTAVATEWAQHHNYPLADSRDLMKVAQYRYIKSKDAKVPKEEIIEEFRAKGLPDFSQPNQVHGVLAGLPLPVYLTTNYDNFMAEALRKHNKDPREVVCPWHKDIREKQNVDDFSYQPSTDAPLVFHFHGHWSNWASLVLTEEDYVEFLRELAVNFPLLVPTRIQQALTDTRLLFLGYGIGDWTFRLLLQTLQGCLAPSVQQLHLTVQLEPDEPDKPAKPGWTPQRKQAATDYLDQYYDRFQNMRIQVYWGTCEGFVNELRQYL